MKLDIIVPITTGVQAALSRALDRHGLVRVVSGGGNGKMESVNSAVVNMDAVKRYIERTIMDDFRISAGLCPIRIEWTE